MTNDQLLTAPGRILHLPTVLGAVVPVYRIPNLTAELKFSGPLLADIFLGRVTKWNDAIGYVELIYAVQSKTAYGSVQNMAGEFVKASESSVTAAAAAAASQMPADFRVSITNAPGRNVYPVSSFTWLLFYENPKDKNQARIMLDFMKWALTDGQKLAAPLGYAPLPPDVVKLEVAALAKIKTS